MTSLIDLTRQLEVVKKEGFPPQLLPLYRIISPEVEFVDHAAGAEIMQAIFNCSKSDLPCGEGWAEENLSISSHLGTHVDAPWHYGSTCDGEKAKTVDQIPLESLYCNAFKLDFTSKKASGSAITVDDLKRELDKIEYTIKAGDACLINTGHDKFALDDPMRYHYPGMIRESASWLAEQGAKIGGTDATGWDRPFHVMVAEFIQTRDKSKIWDAHYAHRDREFYVVQQLCNLEQLPAKNFKVGFFPLLLVGASAAPARVVAFVD
ncbi:MAG: cyclase family protein [Candidatus Obscuribacterales bacterium]|nr:cyclase family protein [Candidatus Obscuribacterales bacterium]